MPEPTPDAAAELVEARTDYLAARSRRDAAEAEMKLAQERATKLLEQAGADSYVRVLEDETGAKSLDKVWTITRTSRQTVDTKRLRESYPDIAEHFSRVSETVSVRVG